MTFFSIVVISIGLAMDAFAVSISEGVSLKRVNIRHSLAISCLFAAFQAFMPLIGYLVGSFFYDYINQYSRYITFILLVFIGLKMIYEGYNEEACIKEGKCKLCVNHIFLAIATSIDALAVGFSFSFLKLNIYKAVSIIGIITFLISFIGVYIGHRLGKFCNTKVEYAGGLILILMGIKALIW